MNNWVVIVGGFATSKRTYEEEIEDLEKMGKNVLFLNPIDNFNLEKYGLESPDLSIPRAIRIKAEAVYAELTAKGIEHADFIGHSQGAAIVALLAHSHPEIADLVVLVNPCGLTGRDTPFLLTLRFLRQLVSEVGYAIFNRRMWVSLKASWALTKSLAQAPMWHLREEIPGIASLDFIPLLHALREKRVSIFLLTAHADRVFPKPRINATLGENTLSVFNGWTEYIREGASHNAPYLETPGAFSHILTGSQAENQSKRS